MTHKLVSVPVDPKVHSAIEKAAAMEMRSLAAYCRLVIYKDLQERGLLDDEFKPTKEVTDASNNPEGV